MTPDITRIAADRQLVSGLSGWSFRNEVMRCVLMGYSLALPKDLLISFIVTSQPHRAGGAG